ncbi:MAG: ABC-2 family transporter protein [Planctomycetota bacterium]|nr:ABC-2 family transporter protein [Planctomycetota bacterium]
MTAVAVSPTAKYRHVALLGARQTFVERGALVARSAFVLLILLVFSRLWETVRELGGLGSMGAADLLWYLAVTEWVAIGTLQTWVAVQEDVRTGDIAYLLPRPMSYVGYRVAEGLGRVGAHMLVIGAASLLGAWAFSGSLPSAPAGLLLAAPLAMLASAVLVVFYIWVGLLAFWLQDAQPAYFIFQKLLFVFGGLMLPLTIYPEWLRTISLWTPFSALLYGPASLVFEGDAEAALWTALRLVFWGAAAALLLRVTYARARRRLEVNGG